MCMMDIIIFRNIREVKNGDIESSDDSDQIERE